MTKTVENMIHETTWPMKAHWQAIKQFIDTIQYFAAISCARTDEELLIICRSIGQAIAKDDFAINYPPTDPTAQERYQRDVLDLLVEEELKAKGMVAVSKDDMAQWLRNQADPAYQRAKMPSTCAGCGERLVMMCPHCDVTSQSK